MVDVETGKPAGAITGLHRVAAVAIAPAIATGYALNAAQGSITPFPLDSGERQAEFSVGPNPHRLFYDPDANRLLVLYRDRPALSAFSSDRGRRLNTVALPEPPAAALADGFGHVYLALPKATAIAVLDTRTLQQTAQWSTAPCQSPQALALDRSRHQLFIGCGNGLVAALDTRAGKLLGSASAGTPVSAVAFDIFHHMLMAASAATLTAFQIAPEGGLQNAAALPTTPGQPHLVIDFKSHWTYLVVASPKPAAPLAVGIFERVR